MTNGSQDGLFRAVFGMPSYAPAWFAVLLVGLLLLLTRELPESIRIYMIPSLVVYGIGAAILGTIHRLISLHYQSPEYNNNERPIPVKVRLVILGFHLLWFAALITYNFWRKVL
jgi:hypothetical protein